MSHTRLGVRVPRCDLRASSHWRHRHVPRRRVDVANEDKKETGPCRSIPPTHEKASPAHTLQARQSAQPSILWAGLFAPPRQPLAWLLGSRGWSAVASTRQGTEDGDSVCSVYALRRGTR